MVTLERGRNNDEIGVGDLGSGGGAEFSFVHNLSEHVTDSGFHNVEFAGIGHVDNLGIDVNPYHIYASVFGGYYGGGQTYVAQS